MIYEPEVQTLAAIARVRAARNPERVALSCEGRSLNYAALAEHTARAQAMLAARGIGRGDRVGLLSKESIDSVVLVLAVAQAGATIVPINWRLAPPEVAFILRDSECKIVFAGAEHQTLAHAADSCEVGSLEALLSGPAPLSQPAMPEVDRFDVAAQIYTSGTTGKPKGVELPHESFFAIAREFHQRNETFMHWSADDVALCVLPLFHVGGLWTLVRTLASGAHAVLLPQFIGWQAVDAIETYKVTKTAMIPIMIQIMLAEPDASPRRFASLREIAYGGSPITPALLQQAASVLRCEFYQVYGLTETGNMAVSLGPDDHLVPSRLSSAGRPLPGVRVKIVDGDRELPPGQVGEICLHSPAAMRGYWKNPAATRATLRDGWVHTGDAGFCDENGYLYICDRLKDMICAAGEKVWPTEVEAVLASHPAVREIAVIGVPHPEWGEAVRAVIVPHPGSDPLGLRELRAFGRKQLAEFKLPTSLELVEMLPRTPAGKVRKNVLRDAAVEPRAASVS
jgi:acyl-CoA synthetase (AMP-forming)/AMP-acid ligase II